MGGGIFSFGWSVFEGEILFPDSDGEIPGVILLPVPLRGEASPIQLLGTGSVVTSSHCCLLVPAASPDGCPMVLILEESLTQAYKACRAFQGCSVDFPKHKGWNTGEGVESMHGLMLQYKCRIGMGFTNTFCY